MSDPTRLLSAGSDADELERSLLESLQQGPEDAQKAAVWGTLSAQLATVAVVVGTSTAASSSAAVGAVAASASAATAATAATKANGLLAGAAALLPKALAAKVALAVGVVAVGAAGVGQLATRVQPRGRQPVVQPVVQTVRAPHAPTHEVAPPRAIEPAAEAVEPARPGPQRAASRVHKRGARADALAAESGLLTSARAQLRAGDTVAAEATLSRLRQQFARGVLVQEREVLQIELLEARGQRALARARAQAFVRAHPESPHSEALTRFLGEL